MREHLDKFTLLYAEDCSDVRENMIEYFDSYFKEVFVAKDGKEALELYEKNEPDVAILDINMPHMTGLELAKKIRERDSNTRIVMLSAHTEVDLLLDAVEINMTKYLVKPIKRKELKEALNKISEELFSLSSKIIKFDEDSYYDLNTKSLVVYKQEVKLSIKEQKLLELFILKINDYVSIEDIMAVVWEEYFDKEISINSVKMQVSNLRKKLSINCIENVYGKGYILKINS